MELLTLRDQVYQRIQQGCPEDTAPAPPATPAAQQALRAWKRRHVPATLPKRRITSPARVEAEVTFSQRGGDDAYTTKWCAGMGKPSEYH